MAKMDRFIGQPKFAGNSGKTAKTYMKSESQESKQKNQAGIKAFCFEKSRS